jgi:hypothetical protein
MLSFFKDRLGTNIGKENSNNTTTVFSGGQDAEDLSVAQRFELATDGESPPDKTISGAAAAGGAAAGADGDGGEDGDGGGGGSLPRRQQQPKQFSHAPDSMGGDFTTPPVFLESGGGLVSTASDYLRFAQMLVRRPSGRHQLMHLSEATEVDSFIGRKGEAG